MRPSTLVAASLLLIGSPDDLRAQLITPKTVPVHQREQFEIFPSSRLAMGGASIALDDTLLDPFVNPATAVRARRPTVFTTPFAHRLSGDRGGGRTIPLGALGPVGDWSVGGVVALQRLEPTSQWFGPSPSSTNRYVAGAVAHRLRGGVALGASGYRADLRAIEGVDQLYGFADTIHQRGHLVDLRFGATKDWSGQRTLEVVLLHNRAAMTHDVHFPELRGFEPNGRPVVLQTESRERNADRTNVWGAHAQYSQPIDAEGLRVGWLVTVNQLTHGSIPGYRVSDIPFDPGVTKAVALGFGVGRAKARSSYGMDLSYEPMWSRTWGTAVRDTMTVGGNPIPAGGRAVDNRFRFRNVNVRVGGSRSRPLGASGTTSIDLQLGLAVSVVNYRLRQTDHVQESLRSQHENWEDLMPTFGLGLRSRSVNVSYRFRLACSPGSCVLWSTGSDASAPPPSASGVLAAPSRPVQFNWGTAQTHTLSISVPLR